ncbi:MAG: amino acid aminotransferase [Chlamydiales bacterium]
MAFFKNVKPAPADPILDLTRAFAADKRENKVNLGVGAYKTIDLEPLILSSVKKAEALLLERETSKDYLPIEGFKKYLQASKELIFGSSVSSDHVVSVQSVGGTGALRVGAIFLKQQGCSTVSISVPTWGNHPRIFKQAGFEVKTHSYLDVKGLCFDFESFSNEIQNLPPKTVLLLQPSCHNPTGFDPTFEQWQEICKWVRAKELFVFFDLAYQGFGEDLEKDVSVIRYFGQQEGLQFAVAVSYSKNFGLYAERTGALFFVVNDSEKVDPILSNLKEIIRGIYSNPPCHGARIVNLILENPELKEHWVHELITMRDRISEMRKALMAELQSKVTKHSFEFLAHQKGMFSYLGLNGNQVDQLIAEYGIYMTRDSRINVAGLNTENIGYVAEAIAAVIE